MPSQRTRHPREIDFRLLRSVGAKNYGLVSSDARKEADENPVSSGAKCAIYAISYYANI